MRFPRSSGVLLHPTSLPGRFGIGDIGVEARKFVDFLSESGQSLWQILPLGPTGYGDSPYQCFSSFAGNPLLISPQQLVEEGLLSKEDLKHQHHFSNKRVRFGRVIEYKNGLLARAFDNFKQTTSAVLREDFGHFCQFAAAWLDDYALFRSLGESHGGAAWNTWEPALVRREQKALGAARRELGEKIEAQRFYQYLFFKQWGELKAYCREKNVKIIGDMPIFAAYNSSDVWTHPDLFKLDDRGNPRVVAGVPPDYFSKTGQLWGNPIYNWDRIKETGYRWWIDRVRAILQLVDIVRTDHFRGFSATWEVPAADKTAENGQWIEVPGKEFFETLKKEMGDVPVIAEDLGLITPEVERLRDVLGLPGMRVLQFAFGGDPRDTHLPHNYARNTVVYTGTHDSDTVVGWYQSQAGEGSTRSADQIKRERAYCMKHLRSDGKEIHWDFIRAAFASVADLAIIPAQDLLGLDSSARMNVPASDEGNWNWRMEPHTLTAEISARLKEMTEMYARLPAQPEEE
jgi:4-alpha-glucanotransferase